MKILSGFSNLRRTMTLIAGCFVLVALVVIVVAVISRSYSRQGTQQTETLTAQFLPGLVTLARLQESTLKVSGIALQFADPVAVGGLAGEEAGAGAVHGGRQRGGGGRFAAGRGRGGTRAWGGGGG